MLQRANDGHIVAQQSLVRELEIGLFLHEPDQLARELSDPARMNRLRETLSRRRLEFTFDHHADRLVAFFRDVTAARAVASADRVLPARSIRSN